MRIALVSAPYDNTRFKVGESLGLRYLAAAAQSAGHEVDLFEMNEGGISKTSLAENLARTEYGLVGFGALFSSNLKRVVELAETVRACREEAHFTIGGQGISFLWQEVLSDSAAFNSAVCFEGELTLVELADALDSGASTLEEIPGLYLRSGGKLVFTGFREPISNLDSLPFPARFPDFVLGERPVFNLISSRGCNARCTFCASGNFANNYHRQARWRQRSAVDVIEEIDSLVESYGECTVNFVDDDFLGACREGPERAASFLQFLGSRPYALSWMMETRVNEVKRSLLRDMRDKGLFSVLCGVDSANHQDLKIYGKGASLEQAHSAIETLRELGISIDMGFIMFHPLSTLETVRENLAFLRQVELAGFDELTNKLQFYAGSPLLRYFSRRCQIDFKDFSYSYRMKDSRIEALWKAMLRSLRPFRVTLRRLRLARLSIQANLPIDAAGAARLSNLRTIEQMGFKHQLDLAEQLLGEVVGMAESQTDDFLESLEETFVSEGRARALQLSDELRREHALRRMRSCIEDLPVNVMVDTPVAASH